VPRERLTEIEMEEDVPEIEQVLHPPRMVEPEPVPHRASVSGEIWGLSAMVARKSPGASCSSTNVSAETR